MLLYFSYAFVIFFFLCNLERDFVLFYFPGMEGFNEAVTNKAQDLSHMMTLCLILFFSIFFGVICAKRA